MQGWHWPTPPLALRYEPEEQPAGAGAGTGTLGMHTASLVAVQATERLRDALASQLVHGKHTEAIAVELKDPEGQAWHITSDILVQADATNFPGKQVEQDRQAPPLEVES